MSWLKRLIGMFTGKNDHHKEQMSVSVLKWEQERKNKLVETEANLKDWLVALVKEKKELPFSWESGSDEAFISFKDYAEWDSNNFEDLETYLIAKLDIPDTGEFEMTGEGFIYIDGKSLKAKYKSIAKDVSVDNEETRGSVYREDESDKGDKVLFDI